VDYLHTEPLSKLVILPMNGSPPIIFLKCGSYLVCSTQPHLVCQTPNCVSHRRTIGLPLSQILCSANGVGQRGPITASLRTHTHIFTFFGCHQNTSTLFVRVGFRLVYKWDEVVVLNREFLRVCIGIRWDVHAAYLPLICLVVLDQAFE